MAGGKKRRGGSKGKSKVASAVVGGDSSDPPKPTSLPPVKASDDDEKHSNGTTTPSPISSKRRARQISGGGDVTASSGSGRSKRGRREQPKQPTADPQPLDEPTSGGGGGGGGGSSDSGDDESTGMGSPMSPMSDADSDYNSDWVEERKASLKAIPMSAEVDVEKDGFAGAPPGSDVARKYKAAYDKHLEEVLKKRKGAPIRVYADGIYDMFHYGHGRALEQAKRSFPNAYLLVGCCDDKLTHARKGMTVFHDFERYESLRHCKWVDEVVTSAPWVLTDDFIKEHDIDFVCHDAEPYTTGADDSEDIYAEWKSKGVFKETKRTEGVSTSDVIVRIVRDYDKFVRRNLKRGHKREDMNVSFIKERQIRLGMLTEDVKRNMEKWSKKSFDMTRDVVRNTDKLLHDWGKRADHMQHDFVALFSRNGALRARLRRTRTELGKRLKSLF